MLQAGGRYLLGPKYWEGEQRVEKTGSMSMLSWPTWMTAVE